MIRTFDHEEVKELAYWAEIPDYKRTDRFAASHAGDRRYDDDSGAQRKTGRPETRLCRRWQQCRPLPSVWRCQSRDGCSDCRSGRLSSRTAQILAMAQADAAATGAKLWVVEDPGEAVRDADIIYTDVWASMGQESQADEKEKQFLQYQVNQELMAGAKKDAIVLHCLPAKRGKEITDEVIDGSQSVVFDEAENRLHAHKAIMAVTM